MRTRYRLVLAALCGALVMTFGAACSTSAVPSMPSAGAISNALPHSASVVYAAAGGACHLSPIFALDQATGKVVNHIALTDQLCVNGMGVGPNGDLYTSSVNGNFVAFNATLGSIGFYPNVTGGSFAFSKSRVFTSNSGSNTITIAPLNFYSTSAFQAAVNGQSITFDRLGRLYVFSNNNVLAVYAYPKTKAAWTINAGGSQGSTVVVDSKGVVYLGSGGGVQEYTLGASGKSTRLPSSITTGVTSIALDSSDNLYAISQFNPGLFVYRPRMSTPTWKALPTTDCQGIAVGKFGRVFAACGEYVKAFSLLSGGHVKPLWSHKIAPRVSAIAVP